ncbi:chorismate pyruvate-lyase family protein [Nonomuraea sediminis]|uniref:chorismate pyruvate-lyase family protein n=1 Tax=Nonomuraea sediminis TaxID=2835864 RepID=UPI001BDCD916|nr:chorismate pyruvate-lyase family protein [Nonomuraea sediminis]
MEHPITRMILSHDGSTTRLLEELLREPLALRTTLQTLREAHAVLPRRLQARLQVDPADLVVLRRSQLVTGSGWIVTSNKVVGNPLHPAAQLALAAQDRPLGLVLRAHRLEQHRDQLAAGTTSWYWPGHGHLPSCWRDYLITVSGRPALYIRETFHPEIAPVDVRPVEPLAL